MLQARSFDANFYLGLYFRCCEKVPPIFLFFLQILIKSPTVRSRISTYARARNSIIWRTMTPCFLAAGRSETKQKVGQKSHIHIQTHKIYETKKRLLYISPIKYWTRPNFLMYITFLHFQNVYSSQTVLKSKITPSVLSITLLCGSLICERSLTVKKLMYFTNCSACLASTKNLLYLYCIGSGTRLYIIKFLGRSWLCGPNSKIGP